MVRQDPQATLSASARMKRSIVGRVSDGKKVTFACCFLLSKLNLTLHSCFLFFNFGVQGLRGHDCDRAVSDPCVHLARKKGESEEEGVEIVHFFADDYNWPL